MPKYELTLGPMPNATHQQFDVLSFESIVQISFEAVSYSLLGTLSVNEKRLEGASKTDGAVVDGLMLLDSQLLEFQLVHKLY